MQGKRFNQSLRTATLVAGVLLGHGLAHAQEVKVPPMDPLFIRWGNGLPTEYLVLNALVTNPTANLALSDNPLDKDSFEKIPALHDALHDPGARYFMKYLVSCALDATQEVSWTPTYVEGETQVWKGGGGICPSWHESKPSLACLEQVSACILARNNPKRFRVRLSLQCTVEGCPDVLKPQETVAPDVFLPSRVIRSGVRPAQLIPSFLPCHGSTRGDCGWYPLVTGTCEEGTSVTLTATAGNPISGSLRICDKPQGCSETDSSLIKEEPFVSTDTVQVGFVCGSSRAFSVMSRRPEMADEGNIEEEWHTVDAVGVGATISSEEASFPNREGAFWGNLFGTGAILSGLVVKYDAEKQATLARLPEDPSVYVRQDEGWCRRVGTKCVPAEPVVRELGPIYRRMHVCSAPGWSGDEEDLPGRVCALPEGNGNCAAHLEGDCDAACKKRPDGTFEDCQAEVPDSTGQYPITTFLSEPAKDSRR